MGSYFFDLGSDAFRRRPGGEKLAMFRRGIIRDEAAAMSEMVKRVAKAIGEAKLEWEGDSTGEVALRACLARAAIAAMREPLWIMIEAGRWPAEDEGPVACWRAMIDAALAAEPVTDSADKETVK
jgi:hypothetical protein